MANDSTTQAVAVSAVISKRDDALLIIDLDCTRSQRPERCTVAEYISANELSDEDATEFRIALIEKGYADVGGGAAPAYRIQVEGCAFATADDDPSSTTRSDLQPAPNIPSAVPGPNSLSHSQSESEMAGGTLAQAVSPVPFADQSAREASRWVAQIAPARLDLHRGGVGSCDGCKSCSGTYDDGVRADRVRSGLDTPRRATVPSPIQSPKK